MSIPMKADFSNFPKGEGFAQIEGKIFIAENINSAEHTVHIESMKHPVQLGMALFFICTNGSLHIRVNVKDYVIERMMGITCSTGTFMQITKISKDFKGLFLAISNDFIDHGSNVKAAMAIYKKIQEKPFFNVKEDRVSDQISLIKYLKNKLLDPEFMFKEEIAQHIMGILLLNGYQAYISQNRQEEIQRHRYKNRKDEIFELFIKEVQEDYTMERNVKYYANKLCITPKYLSSIVHEVSGKYATEWIDEYVIMESKALLRNSTMSIKEICQHLNFANQSFFAKYFKQHTGYTPKQYRNNE